MSDTILGALIGIGGVLVGGILTFVFQFILNKINWKKENRRSTYQLKIDTYADAIRYIALCCTGFQHKKEIEYFKDIVIKQDELYNKFHPIFSIIANKDTIEKYNELRNEASDGKINHADAYKKVVQLLNFNINDEI